MQDINKGDLVSPKENGLDNLTKGRQYPVYDIIHCSGMIELKNDVGEYSFYSGELFDVIEKPMTTTHNITTTTKVQQDRMVYLGKNAETLCNIKRGDVVEVNFNKFSEEITIRKKK